MVLERERDEADAVTGVDDAEKDLLDEGAPPLRLAGVTQAVVTPVADEHKLLTVRFDPEIPAAVAKVQDPPASLPRSTQRLEDSPPFACPSRVTEDAFFALDGGMIIIVRRTVPHLAQVAGARGLFRCF